MLSFSRIGTGILYRDTETIGSNGSLVFDNSGPSAIGSNIETLAPGLYQVFFNNQVRNGFGGSASGSFNLTLNSRVVEPPPNGNSVPDAGSTMVLTRMALCTVGGIARRLKH